MTTTRSLTTIERPLYAAHLKRLNSEDRYLRFGYVASDAMIDKYVESQFRTRSTILAAFDANLNVIAAIEIVYDNSKYTQANKVAEVGLSVEEAYRGKGIGSDLFERSLAHARNRGVKTMCSHCLRQNRFMARIALKHGMELHSEGAETTGELKLQTPNISTALQEMIGEGMGMWDYSMLAARGSLGFNYGALASRLDMRAK